MKQSSWQLLYLNAFASKHEINKQASHHTRFLCTGKSREFGLIEFGALFDVYLLNVSMKPGDSHRTILIIYTRKQSLFYIFLCVCVC